MNRGGKIFALVPVQTLNQSAPWGAPSGDSWGNGGVRKRNDAVHVPILESSTMYPHELSHECVVVDLKQSPKKPGNNT
jgi:hypothetical protein